MSFFFWPLCCLSFFNLRIRSTPLVSSSSSYCCKHVLRYEYRRNIAHLRLNNIKSIKHIWRQHDRNKSTAHGCWKLDFFVSDIKLQAIYKVIHTSNYDSLSKYVCKIGNYNQRGIIFSCNTILVHMK